MARPAPPFWLTGPSRFATLPRSRARWALLLLIGMVAAALTALATPDPAGPPDSLPPSVRQNELWLYGSIVDSMRAGGDYYSVAESALRAGDYPLRPFTAFRLPTLAAMEALLPYQAIIGLLWALGLTVALVWHIRLRSALSSSAARICAIILLAGGIVACVQPALILFHEVWAALLIALSMGLWRPGRWFDAAAVGLCAMLIRETAALYVLVMAVLAWRSGARRELFGWIGTLAIFAIILTIHAIAVAKVTGPLDAAATGWLATNGVGFFIRALTLSTALHSLPLALAAILIALSLYGWAGWADPLGHRVFATLLAYAAMIALFIQADSFSAALMIAPLSLIGIAFAPDSVRDTVRAWLDIRRVRVQRITR
ncbi:MAG: hypothetical protein CMN72_05510 [Sphingomonas sp.]|nr:hypothetical protein [Sphingomonas sp.]